MKISNRNKILYLLTIIVVLGGDLLTKTIINHQMKLGASYELIPNFFYFTNIHNTGAAWGIFAGHIEFFYVITAIAAIAIVYYFLHSSEDQVIFRYGLVLVFAGLLGNLYDRIVFQYVRDFLDFIIFGYDFPIFNVADMGVVIGMFLIIIDLFIGEYKQWKFNQSHPQ